MIAAIADSPAMVERYEPGQSHHVALDGGLRHGHLPDRAVSASYFPTRNRLLKPCWSRNVLAYSRMAAALSIRIASASTA